MRPFTSLTIALISAFAASLSAQTVSTVPVGFNTVTVNSGRLAGISLPFDNIAAFAGAVSSRTSSTITTTGAGFGSLSTAAAPNVVRFVTGTSTGRQFKITGNTTD